MTRVLVAGAGGQLGRALVATAPADAEVVALDRVGLDVTDGAAVARTIAQVAPSVVLNASGWTAVDAAEGDEAGARAVNAAAPGHLARACAAHGARLVHVGTDYVFDGAVARPYRATDAPNPLSAYGRTKLAGERAVLEGCPDALVVRASWVHSAGGANFVTTMLRVLRERRAARVVADQVGSPTWARGLADALWAAARRHDVTGVVHWCDAGVASWYDLAVAVAEDGGALGLVPPEATVTPIASGEWPQAAARPAWSVLDVEGLDRRLGIARRHWRVQLRAMLAEHRALA